MNSQQRRVMKRKIEKQFGTEIFNEIRNFIKSPFKQTIMKRGDTLEYIPDYLEQKQFLGEMVTREGARWLLKKYLQDNIPDVNKNNVEKYYTIENK